MALFDVLPPGMKAPEGMATGADLSGVGEESAFTGLGIGKPAEPVSLPKEAGKAIVRGIGGVGEMGAHLVKLAGAEETGKALEESSAALSEKFAMHPELQKSFAARGILGGLESMPASVSAGIPGAIVGAKLGAAGGSAVAPGPGTLLGGIGGGLLGYALSGASLMGLSEYQNYLDEYEKEFGKTPDSSVKASAALSGLAEGGFEGLSDLIGGAVVFKPVLASGAHAIRDIIRAPFKKGAKEFLKDYGKIAATETGTEMATAAGEAYARQREGMETPGIGEAVKESIIPALTMSTLFMGGGTLIQKHRMDRIEKSLEDPTISPEERVRAAQDVDQLIQASNVDPATGKLTDFGAQMSQAWKDYALQSVKNGQAIDLDKVLDPQALQIETGLAQDPAAKAIIDESTAAVKAANVNNEPVTAEKSLAKEPAVFAPAAPPAAPAVTGAVETAAAPVIAPEAPVIPPAAAPEVAATETKKKKGTKTPVSKKTHEKAPEKAPEKVAEAAPEISPEITPEVVKEEAKDIRAGIPPVFVGMSDKNLDEFRKANPTNEWANKEFAIREAEAKAAPAAPVESAPKPVVEKAAEAPLAKPEKVKTAAQGKKLIAEKKAAKVVAPPIPPAAPVEKGKPNAARVIAEASLAPVNEAIGKLAPEIAKLEKSIAAGEAAGKDMAKKKITLSNKQIHLSRLQSEADQLNKALKESESLRQEEAAPKKKVTTAAKAKEVIAEKKAAPVAKKTQPEAKPAVSSPKVQALLDKVSAVQKAVNEREKIIAAKEKAGESAASFHKSQEAQKKELNRLKRELTAATAEEMKAKPVPVAENEDLNVLNDSLKILNNDLKKARKDHDEAVRLERPPKQVKILAQTIEDIKQDIADTQEEINKLTGEPKLTRAPEEAKGMSVEYIMSVVDRIKSKMANPPPIEVIPGMNTLLKSGTPEGEALKSYMEDKDMLDENGEDRRTLGLVWKGKMYIIAENHTSEEEVLRTYAHELTHNGLGAFFDRVKAPGMGSIRLKYEILMDKIWQAHKAEVENIVATTHQQYDLDVRTDRRKACEEWLCNQTYDAQPKWYDRLVAIFNDVLRVVGIDVKLSDAEVRTIIRDSFKTFGTRTYDTLAKDPMFKIVSHGTPYLWQPEPGFPHGRPRLDKVGTGEGHTAYGWGWYSAELEDTARRYLKGPKKEWSPDRIIEQTIDNFGSKEKAISYYRNRLKLAQGSGRIDYIEIGYIESFIKKIEEYEQKSSLYQLDIPDDVVPKLMDFDKLLSEQSEYVKNALKPVFKKYPDAGGWWQGKTPSPRWAGVDMYSALVDIFGSDKPVSEYLASLGIPGNVHRGFSRGATGEKYVIWDQKVLDRIALLKRNGEKLEAINEGMKEAAPSFRRIVWIEPDIEKQVMSTRVPTAKNASEDPLMDNLFIDYRVTVADQDSLEKNLDALDKTPNVRYLKGAGAKGTVRRLEAFLDHAVSNLLFLHGLMPKKIKNRAKLWYDGGNKIVKEWGSRYGISDMQASGIIAVMSPQKDWYTNVSISERTADIYFGVRDVRWDEAMDNVADEITKEGRDQEVMDRAKGKTLAELDGDTEAQARWIRVYDQAHNNRSYRILTPEGGTGDYVKTTKGMNASAAWGSYSTIAKAISILKDGTAENIHYQLGGEHKVRSFYNNLLHPNNPVGFATIDTHAVAADFLRPLSGNDQEVAQSFGTGKGASSSSITGQNGLYPIHYEAYRRAAKEVDLLPREMQSIAWEGVRGLFERGQKQYLKERAESIWMEYKRDRISQEEAQQQILEMAGGMAEPTWAGIPFNDTVGRTYEGASQKAIDKKAGPEGITKAKLPKIFLEVAPDPDDAVRVSIWNSLSDDAKNEITNRVINRIVPKVLSEVGTRGFISVQIGGFEGATSPSIAVSLDRPEQAIKAAKLLGYALSQKSMMVVSDTKIAGADPVGVVTIVLPEGYGHKEIKELYDRLWTLEKDGQKLVGGHSTANGKMAILNFTDLDTRELGDIINTHLGNDFDVRTNTVFASYPEKKDYDYAIDRREGTAAGRPSVQRNANLLREEADSILREEFAQRGAPSFSRRAEPAERVRPAGKRVERKGVTRSSGQELIDQGTHYSNQQRDRLDSKFYGTGLADAASRRLPSDPKSPLRQRIHFYYDPGTGMPKAEVGVGAYAHNADLSKYKIYNLTSGVIKVDRVEGEHVLNTFEKAIMKAGFDGFSSPDYGVVVLIGKRTVPVEPVEPQFSRVPKETDARYLELAKEPDKNKAELQKMVADAAKAAGYNVEAWHGTENSEYSVFDETKIGSASGNHGFLGKGFYFFAEKNFADYYGKSKRFFLSMRNPLVLEGKMDTETIRKINKASDTWAFSEGDTADNVFNGFSFSVPEFPDLAEKISTGLQDMGHDGVIYKSGETAKTEIVAYSPTQIKSADPVTRDSNGNVIPLSERFNPETPDIRFQRKAQTNTPEFKKWFGDSKVIDENGEPLVVYHGTSKSFNTFVPGGTEKWLNGRINPKGYLPSGPAIWFSDNKENQPAAHNMSGRIEGYKEGANVMPSYLKIDRPLLLDDSTMLEWAQTVYGKGNQSFPMLLSEDGVRAIKDDGYDGIVFTNKAFPTGEKYNEYIVFDAKQIKSATGNVGTFDETNPDIRFSRAPANAAPASVSPGNNATWNASGPSPFKTFFYTMIDKQVDLRETIKDIEKFAGTIKDTINASLKEILYSGRVAALDADFLDYKLRPIYNDLARRNIDITDFEEYLWYRHAEEANDYVATISDDDGNIIGMQDKGSGKSYQEIRDYFAALSPSKQAVYEEFARKVDVLTRENAQLMVDYQLESQAVVDKWLSKYKHYVPLFREHIEDARIGTGSGLTVTGSVTRRRKGSEKPVVDILANIAMQRERIIASGEKNKIATAIYALAKNYPNEQFWKVVKPPMRKTIDMATKEPVWVPDPNYKKKDNVVMSRQLDGGKIVERGVEFNMEGETPRRMAASLRNIDMDTLGMVLGTSARVTRFIASMNTQWNPIFGVTNFVRDVGTAMFNLTTTPIAGRQKEVMSHAIPAMKGVWEAVRAQREGKRPTSEWGKLFNEFQMMGGQTGYRDLFKTSRERSERIDKEMREAMAGKTVKLGFALRDLISDYNTSMENAIRLASYKTGIDRGMSKEQAAAMAKSLTVNFNRKGQIATQAGALYAFFNASAQGAAKVYETLTGPAGKKIIWGGLMFGVLQAAMLAAAGMKEDEPPEFVQEKNIIIPIGGGKYATIPMPLGFNVLPNIGRMSAQFAMGGFKDPFTKMANLFGVILDGFNPLGASKTLLQTISPTPIDPLVALAENKDWTGKPIYREDFSSLHPTPGFTRTKDTATWGAKGLAWGLNMLTGGTRATPGFLSPTPDMIDYLVGQATGGVGREFGKVQQVAQSLATGEELPAYKVPLTSRFYGTVTGEANEGTRYYNNLKLMNRHEDEIKDLIKHREPIREYLSENPEARLWHYSNSVESTISKLKKRKSELIARNADPRTVKAIDALMRSHMKRFNERVEAAKG